MSASFENKGLKSNRWLKSLISRSVETLWVFSEKLRSDNEANNTLIRTQTAPSAGLKNAARSTFSVLRERAII